MNATSIFNTFNFCRDAIVQESKQFNCRSFNETHCSVDSRDTNFNKVESRLAYTYKFGCFNIELVEKCISNFLIDYSESKTIFPVENLKVCSFSNGPGLDIVGLLSALYKSNIYLKKIPELKAINLYNSWLNMYKTLVHRAYEVATLKPYCGPLPSENIHLIQSDIYAELSQEAERCISDSNVLLMVKVFASTKATADTFASTLEKIFSLIKPGTLIFFVGSKHNKQKISDDCSLTNSVKCIFGPQTVAVKILSLDEAVVNHMSIKPLKSGDAYFLVWQKREVALTLEIATRKKTEEKKASKTTGDPSDENTSEILEDTDVESEVSFTSCSNSLSEELSSDSPVNTENKNVPETTVQNNYSSANQSLKNVFKIASNITAKRKDINNSDNRNSYDLQALIQRCDSLVTSLEKMTADIKRDESSRNDQASIQKCCCANEPCSKFSTIPQFCTCSANTVHPCFRRNTCNCNRVKNISTTACTNSFLGKDNMNALHECRFETGRSADLSRPYVTIPLQNTDIMTILSAGKN